MKRALRREPTYGAVAGRGVGLGIGKLPAGISGLLTAPGTVARGGTRGALRVDFNDYRHPTKGIFKYPVIG